MLTTLVDFNLLNFTRGTDKEIIFIKIIAVTSKFELLFIGMLIRVTTSQIIQVAVNNH